MGTKGKIYTYTIIYSATESFCDKVPYAMAVIEMGPEKVMAQVTNYEENSPIAIGMEVEFLEDSEKLCRLI